MFFRNHKPKVESFEERVTGLKELGFTAAMESAGRCRVTRAGCGAIIEDLDSGKMGIGKAGVLVGGEIALLIHAGYQMFLRAPSGKEVPALATHLKALHEFDDDLREGLGLTTLYNLALGTVCDDHLYDRVEDRDAGPQHHAWDRHASEK